MEKKTEPVIFFFFYQSSSIQPCRQVEGTSKYMVLVPRSFLPSAFLSSHCPAFLVLSFLYISIYFF